jgi:AraC family transcriptional regulator, transcriptional activator of pobA
MTMPAAIPSFGYKPADFQRTPFVFEQARLEDGPRRPRPFPHRHSYCHLLCITAGEGSHMIDFQEHALRPGALFFIAPRQVHQWVAETPVAGYSLKFSADFLARACAGSEVLQALAFEHGSLGPARYLSPAQLAELMPLLTDMAAECADDGASEAQALHQREVLAALLRLLLLRIARLPGQACAAAPPADLARRFMALLETHLLSVDKAAGYAELLQVSPGRLDDAVKRATGRTPAQLMRDHLLTEAKRRLMFTQQPIAELAADLGFADPAYFGRFFRQRTQQSPGDFRRQHA